jgi:hypothetical protein
LNIKIKNLEKLVKDKDVKLKDFGNAIFKLKHDVLKEK